MGDSIRVDLDGTLAGRHVLLDADELNVGLLEDCQSGRFSLVLDSLARAIVGGDLPGGSDRAGLRRLKLDQMNALIGGIDGAFAVPKK